MTSRLFYLITIFTVTVYQTTARDWDTWTKNFNQRINNQLQNDLHGLHTLGARIDAQVRNNLRVMDNLGDRISAQVNNNLNGLNNLGETISQQVYEGLRPVREMQATFRVKFGQEGVTVASYPDRTFIIHNGIHYDCSGIISEKNGSCSGKLTQHQTKEKKDFCYVNSMSTINNWHCIGTGDLSFSYVNGKYDCSSSNNGAALFISNDDYRKLCGMTVNYKYFSNTPLGDHGPNIHCSGSGPYVCTMSETLNQ